MAARKKQKKSTKNVPKKKKAVARRPARKAAKKVARKLPVKNPLQVEKARLERNKKLVLDFYRKMIGDKDPVAARAYMADRYVQHSPYATDGHEGVAEFVKTFKEQFPRHHYDVARVIAEGDYVVLHLHGQEGLNPYGEAVIDIFRVRNGKVVEHWDVIQALPEKSRNPNTPF